MGWRRLTGDQDMKEVFENIYLNNLWNGDESLSGPGSSRKMTYVAQRFIRDKIAGHTFILDMGCGDHNWMSQVPLQPGQTYVGIDIVSFVIERNVREWGSDQRLFAFGDFTKYNGRRADVIVCREALQHLAAADVTRALQCFKENSDWLIATTFPTESLGNTDTGGFYPYNLQRQFGLDNPLEWVSQANMFHEERLALWRL
jgi:2-polyprenyl-3-methyl-5-hydroxy-6-metoxy-1,4-benzoquinol methylase